MNESDLKDNIISLAREVNKSGVNQGTSGNISVRIPRGMILTPSSIPYEEMESNDLLSLDFNGELIEDKLENYHRKSLRPSSEWKLHADILNQRPEINAVLHCHSIHATAVACHGRGIPSFHYMTAVAGGNDIQCAKYATFGTTELSQNALLALKGRFACLLAQHGQIAIAKTLRKAFQIALEVETLAHMYLQASQLGEPIHLSDNQMEEVMKKFRSLKYWH